MLIINKKINFEYNIEHTFEAGIVLLGNEVKSLKSGNVSIQDAFVIIENNEVYILNLNIISYKFSRIDERYNSKRKRKLLLHRSEINKINGFLNKGNTTIVVSKCYTNQKNIIKFEIALATGKKQYDKRQYIKEKDLKREERIKWN